MVTCAMFAYTGYREDIMHHGAPRLALSEAEGACPERSEGMNENEIHGICQDKLPKLFAYLRVMLIFEGDFVSE